MKKLGIMLLVCWMWGCAEKPDELTPYIQKVKPLEQKYQEKLAQYGKYLHTEGMTSMAKDIGQVIEDYQKELEAVGIPEDKYLKAAHNNLMRALKTATKKLVEPDFPTFVPSAQKQVKFIEKAVKKNYNQHLRKQWENAGKTEPFPLQWPGEE